jgi:hypothetical protein
MLSRALRRHLYRLIGVRAVRLDRFEQLVRAEHERNVLEDQLRRFRFLTNCPVAIERICSLAALLRPQQAQGIRKVRVGGPHDGGYVCLEDFGDIEAAISLGTGQDVSWDAELADRGLIVYQYDHTVPGPPTTHANFRFNRRRLGADADDATETIASVLSLGHLARPSSVVLKIDIEEAEWSVFEAASIDALNVFSQVICEFHDFQQVTDDDWFKTAFSVLKKLNEKFAPVHVHANNHEPLLVIGNLLFPQVLEVTYASRGKYTFGETDEVFPSKLDSPNSARTPDYSLGRFVYPI